MNIWAPVSLEWAAQTPMRSAATWSVPATPKRADARKSCGASQMQRPIRCFCLEDISMNMLSRRSSRGQGLVEYALIIALVAIVVIAALVLLGPAISSIFVHINSAL